MKFRAKFEDFFLIIILNNFGQSLALKSLQISLFYRKLTAESEEIRLVYSTEILLNTAMIREVNSTEIINSNFAARETQDSSPSVKRHGYKQSSKLSQLQNTQLNLLTVTFLPILKGTAINLR